MDAKGDRSIYGNSVAAAGCAITTLNLMSSGCVAQNPQIQAILSSYRGDFALPMGLGMILTNVQEELARKYLPGKQIPTWAIRFAAAGEIFGIASFFELLQKTGTIPGVYDPKDFIAYGAGAIAGFLAATGIERLTRGGKKEIADVVLE